MNKQGPGRQKKILIAVCIAATAYIVVEFLRDYTLESIDEKTPSSQTAASNLSITEQTIASSFEEIITRPLFNPERRPEPSAAATVESAPPATPETPVQTGDLNLSAVILTDKQQIALLQKSNDSKLHRLNVGESLDGWIIESIDPDQVKLQRGSETKVIKIIMKKSTAVSKAAALQRPVPVPGGRMPPPTRLQPPASEPPADLAPGAQTPRGPVNDPGAEGAPKQP